MKKVSLRHSESFKNYSKSISDLSSIQHSALCIPCNSSSFLQILVHSISPLDLVTKENKMVLCNH